MAELKGLPCPAGSYHYDLGTYSRRISTKSQDAQKWFDRGVMWCYGFNHEEGVVCFQHAIDHDPECAMAYWGFAYALGPNYNRSWQLFGRDEYKNVRLQTHRAVERAKLCQATPVEKALIRALDVRYPGQDAKENFSVWNIAYADAMEKVYGDFPDDLDVAALYADAMMNLAPWQMWSVATGKPAREARTLQTKAVLERALANGGDWHPGVIHLYIHLMEMSPTPEAALKVADRLRGMVPDAGHLHHMPSHLHILCGNYQEAVKCNAEAAEANEKYAHRNGDLNFYTVYRLHDYHFLVYAAMFAGQYKVAVDTCKKLEDSISDELLLTGTPNMANWLEAFCTLRLHTYIRFGRWEELVALPLPANPDLYCVTYAMTHYAKGVAHAALGNIAEADSERELFREAASKVPESRTHLHNKCVDIMKIASDMLDGEIAYRKRDFDAAFACLRRSGAKSDLLPYEEPWAWMQPPRHALGALLLEQGHVEEAAVEYALDLGIPDPRTGAPLPRQLRHEDNVWALHGYHECLVRLGRRTEAEDIKPRLDKALSIADIKIESSCFCRRGKAAAGGWSGKRGKKSDTDSAKVPGPRI
ncbi:uncharacterized protein E0L32_000376 [Thyridium curvatum]|uniref:TPR domain protein n=1 Tax=Thyridium curvatum TaxID=1093900 RepID=A0A507B195_9PEZI|nr:uncharacterized protein E0L32_000376 [Thyridium curvatum]TPX16042.1 hypothetical protein E0L32_000376 [Thyridium curvatum]